MITAQVLKELAEHHDPNQRQALAANPETSVWVSASAGTGKTKILTDRVLRLMLPRRDQPPESATPPDKILCLTFTKTGASEMADRIHERLSKWSVMPDDKLASVLEALLQYPPDADTMSAARALFAGVVDTPGGMKIMTLHSFCQSVLKRFPLEAGLPPHFEVLDERTANEYLQKALRDIVVEIRKHPDSSVADAFTRLSRTLNAEQFHELMQDIIKNRSAVRKLRNRYPDVENLQSALFKLAGLNRPITAEDYKSEYALPDGDFLALCREHIDPLLSSKGKNDTVLADLLTEFAAADEPSRLRMFDNYALGFLTQKGTIRASVVSKPVSTKFPAFADAAQKEAERLFDLHEKLKAIYLSQMTYDLMVVGFQMMDHYNRAKSAAVQLDYDDLIDYTEQLLDDPEQALWVLYKMDRGIDHILVDEAQDTSPSQWAVVRALAMDFFSGMGARSDTLRTLFVVGDEKQSIFSFQGADPAGFQTMQDYFQEQITQAELNFVAVNLLRSFRSTSAVLETVDHIFSVPATLSGVQTDLTRKLVHEVHWTGQAGRIEVWPLISADDQAPLPPWSPPISVINSDNADVKLAQTIADKIANWLDNHTELPSKGRPIRPGDIMILFRSRGALLDHILRALKDRQIPVSGIDRMVLTEHLAVQDCLKMAEAGLMPQDDLSLATILKSPFIGYDEARLYDLAYARPGTLWDVLRASDPNVYGYIRDLVYKSRIMRPFDFLQSLLVQACPADPVSGRRALYHRLGAEIDDALDEMLNAAMDYEQSHTPQMQAFLSWFAAGEAEVKREQDSSGLNQVRLMTVHASKGLQAPIVFLPDTTSLPMNKFRMVWPETSGLDVPLWAARTEDRNTKMNSQIEVLKTAQIEEYRRLLYVALTRAEDRLYICGAEKGRSVSDQSWYSLCRHMVKTMPGMTEEPLDDFGQTYVYQNPQTAAPRSEKEGESGTARIPPAPVPDWMQKPPPAEPNPPRPLAPSRPSEMEPAIRSPLDAADESKFKRGNITHQLLEYLPELSPENRRRAAETFLARPALDLSPAFQTSILSEIFDILENPEFAPLFSPQSRAEVPVVGLVKGLKDQDNYAVSAQIDRMTVEDDRVMIVDYKTNRPPPVRVQDVPAIYWRQMAAYQIVLERIYPEKKIKCYLLWTDGPNLMPLPDADLKNYRKA